MIYAPLVLVTALLSARSSAEWIPDVSVISDSVEDQHLLADGRRRLRAHDGATEESNEERVGTPPHLNPEFLASSMRKGESSANTLVPHLGSTMPSLTSVTVPLSSSVQMEKNQQTLGQQRHQIYRLIKRRDVDPKVKDKLKALAMDPGSIGDTREELLRKAKDAVIDDMDPKIIDKLQALAKDPGSIGKTREELLKSAKDAVIDDKLNRLKSDKSFTQRMAKLGFNVGDAEVAVQWLRKRLWFLKYDDYSLYLMALGSEYFKEAERSGVDIMSIKKPWKDKYLTSDEFKRWKDRRKDSLHGVLKKVYAKMRWLKQHDEFLKSLEGEELANMAFGSELLKIELNFPPLIKNKDKIETLDLLDQLDRPINQVPNGGNSGPDAKQKAKDILKEDPKTFFGQTATLKIAKDVVIDDMDPKIIDKLQALAKDPGSIGKTREELLKRAEDAVLDDKLNRLKNDISFTQRMAQLGFNVGDAKVAVQWLREEVGLLEYDDYTLYLMALGSEYFEEAESLGVHIKGKDRMHLPKAMDKYAFSDEFKRWKDRRKDSLHGVLEKVHEKMSLLKRDKNLKSLEDEELANMAFGSELFKMRKIKFPPLIKDRDKIETLDQVDRPINQLPKGGNSGPDVKQKAKDILKEDPKTSIGKTAKQLKRKAIDEASGVPLDEETNKKAKVA